MKDLAILITHHRTPPLLRRLLEKLIKEGAISQKDIVILDSAAQKSLGDSIKKQFPGIQYRPFQKNVGYAKLVNVGLREANASFILILNADITLSSKGVYQMLSFLKTKKGGAAVGITDCFRFPSLASVAARRTSLGKTKWGKRILASYEMKDYKRREARAVDWVRGDCWMLRRQAIKDIGFLDERFFMYFEDTDWCRRAALLGWKVYFLPGVKVSQERLGTSRAHTVKGFMYRLIHIISFIKYRFLWNRKRRVLHF